MNLYLISSLSESLYTRLSYCKENVLQFQSTEFSETPSPDSDSVNSVEGHSEPSWFKDIKFDDSDTEQIADEGEDNLTSKLNKNLKLNQ